MNQKGFANIILVVVIVMLVILGGYLFLIRQPKVLITQQTQLSNQPVQQQVQLSTQTTPMDSCKKEKLSESKELFNQSKNFKFPFEPIYAHGSINYPRKIDFSKLIVNYGMFDFSNLHSDGSFCLILNKKQEGGALIDVVDDKGATILQYIVVSPYDDQNIIINLDTTAVALIYMSPGVPSPNSKNAKITLDYINSLKETSGLSAILTKKLSEQNIFLSAILGEEDVVNNIGDVLGALIQKIKNCGGLIEGCAK